MKPHIQRELVNSLTKEAVENHDKQCLRDRISRLVANALDEPKERPTRDQMMMEMARVAAKRGTCCRLKVGAVLAYQGRVISIGYNGARPGHAHCTPSTCNDSSPCLNTIHAEANVINWAKTMGISDFSKMQLFITHTPCLNCAQLIIESGVGEVVYGEAYRCDRGLVCLNQSGTLTVRKVG